MHQAPEYHLINAENAGLMACQGRTSRRGHQIALLWGREVERAGEGCIAEKFHVSYDWKVSKDILILQSNSTTTVQ